MLRWLRGWLGKRIDTELPHPQGTPHRGRSRFLKAKFRDVHVPAGFRVGVRRELGYRLYLPGGSSRRDSLPLIVMLHGCRQDSLSLAGGARMNALAEEGRCAVLYPEQSRRANPLRCCGYLPPVRFIRA